MLCDNNEEITDQVVSGCTVLAPNEYKKLHDRVGQILGKNLINTGMGIPQQLLQKHKTSEFYGIIQSLQIGRLKFDIIIKNLKEKKMPTN